MPSQKNIELLQDAKDRVAKASAIFFVDYTTVTHKDLENLRKTLRATNAELAISKNRLVNLALQEKGIDAKDRLQGPLGAFFAYEDPVKTAKAVFDFFKAIDTAKIKFGVFEGRLIEPDLIKELASLPSREVLIGKLLGLLQSPMRGLVYNLNWTILQFVRTLKAVEEKKAATN